MPVNGDSLGVPDKSLFGMGNFLVTVLIFVVGLAVFHGVMFAIGRNERLWRQLDYVWLGVAALGLILGTGEVRRSITQNSLYLYEARYDGAVERAGSTIRF